MRDLYPITIIEDRYTGTYSGGLFTAWNRYACELPEGPAADDVTCMKFWLDNTEPVGVGNTPEAALADLEHKIFDELDTCPFCGESAILTWDDEGAEVICTNPDCGATIRGETRAEAVRRWNARAAEAGVWEV